MDIPLVANLQPARFAVGNQHVLAPGEYPDHLAKTVAHGDQIAAVAELVAHQPVEPRALRIDVVRRRSVVAGQDHAEQTQAVVALARLAGLLVDQRIAAPGAVAHAGEQATSAPAELGAVAGAAEAGLQAPDTVGATLEMQVAVAGQHQHGALLRLQFGRHRRPAPAPGLRFAAARTAAAQPGSSLPE